MKLIFSTDSFKIGNQFYEGFPILLYDDMTTFKEGVEFLFYHCVKRGRDRRHPISFCKIGLVYILNGFYLLFD